MTLLRHYLFQNLISLFLYQFPLNTTQNRLRLVQSSVF